MEKNFHLFQKINKENRSSDSSASKLRVAEKLNYQNYTKWCKLIRIAIEGQGRLNHIIAGPPSTTDPNYQQ